MQAPKLHRLENENQKLQNENFELREEKMMLEVQLRSLLDAPHRSVSSPPKTIKKTVRETLKLTPISEKGFYGNSYDSDFDIQPVFVNSPKKKQRRDKLVISDSDDDLDLSL